jgi:hypothetical protein
MYVLYDVVDELFLYIHPETYDFTWVDSVSTVIESSKFYLNEDNDTISKLRSFIEAGVKLGVNGSTDLDDFRVFPAVIEDDRKMAIDWGTPFIIPELEELMEAGYFYAPYVPVTTRSHYNGFKVKRPPKVVTIGDAMMGIRPKTQPTGNFSITSITGEVTVTEVTPFNIDKEPIDPERFEFVIYDVNSEAYWSAVNSSWTLSADTPDILYSVDRNSLDTKGYMRQLIWGFELQENGTFNDSQGIFIVEVTSIKDNKYVVDFINRIQL